MTAPTPEPKAPETPPAEPKAPTEVDYSKLSDEQLFKVLEDQRLWKNERLAGLLKDQKELKKLKTDQEALEKAELEKKGEFQKLAEATKADLDKANARIAEMTINQEVIKVATSKGVVDLDAVTKLLDRGLIKQAEDGTITGVTEAIDALATSKSYLFDKSKVKIGDPTNPGAPGGAPGSFKMTEIADPAFYQKNLEAIQQAQREGKIIDDRAPQGTTVS